MATVLERIQYGYDPNSRRTWRRRALTTGEDYYYNYDGLGQVVASHRGTLNLNCSAISATPEHAENWDYDPTGNWHGYRVEQDGSVTLEQDRHHDKGNRLMQIEGATRPFELDRAGRMTLMAPKGGNWDLSQKITWDAWGRIKRIEGAEAMSVPTTYFYDGLNRRIMKDIDLDYTETYYSDTWRPLEERRNGASTPFKQFLWGARHRDDLIRQDRDSTGGGPLTETRYVLMDYFSPAAVVNEAGDVTVRYDFSAFGVRRAMTPDFSPGPAGNLDFSFQGQFLDWESGLLNYGYRYYSPHLGRWTCKDPLRYNGGLNLYGYVGNDAINSVDRFGLQGFGDDLGVGRDPLDPIGMDQNPLHPDYKPSMPPYNNPYWPLEDPTKPTRLPYPWEIDPDPVPPTDAWAVIATCSKTGFYQLGEHFHCIYHCGPDFDSLEFGRPEPINYSVSDDENTPPGEANCWQCKQQVQVRISKGDDSWKKGLKATDYIDPGELPIAQFIGSILESKT